MYGAILGDIIGSPYEFDENNIKTKVFPLFSEESSFTDDSVLTVAVADALLGILGDRHSFGADEIDDDLVQEKTVDRLVYWSRRYPDAGYGARYIGWFMGEDHSPYNSYGNGSAMRASSCGWLAEDIRSARELAVLTAEVTHDHPEGIKGAETVASVIMLARSGASKDEIKEYVAKEFGYDLSRTCGEIRPGYHHIETCQATVPEAVTAFLEGDSFEDVIRTAVSLGGDCDTLTCIAGGMAEAFYGVPEDLKEECRARVTEEMREVLDRFDRAVSGR